MSLLIWSTRVKAYQIVGPSWMQEKNYDLVAKVPAGATMAETRGMLQTLLIERLQIKLHHETRLLSGYEVVVARTGLKLAEGAPAISGAVADKDSGGLPLLPPGITAMKSVTLPNGMTRIMARMVPISTLINLLTSELGAVPVSDNTGLTARYDFTLDYDKDALKPHAPDDPASGTDFTTAVKQQLGLQVQPKHIPVDVMVIDSAVEKPTEN